MKCNCNPSKCLYASAEYDLSQSELFEVIVGAVNTRVAKIKNIDTSRAGKVYFDWDGSRYVVTSSLHCSVTDGRMIHGTSATTLMEKLLRQEVDLIVLRKLLWQR